MICPECKRGLIDVATACRCGWKRPAETEPQKPTGVPCAYDACGSFADCRIKTPTGWANFCEAHHVAYHHQQAQKRLDASGLGRMPDETSHEYAERMREVLRDMKRAAAEKAGLIAGTWRKIA